MTDKEFKRLTRAQLIEVIYQLQLQVDQLTEQKLELEAALDAARDMGLRPREIKKQIERKHIFTHVCWKMRGVYLEVSEEAEGFQWMSAAQIDTEAALPTAFRQFWGETDRV